MLNTFKSAWKISDLKRKIFFTICMLIVFRLGSHIVVPGMDPTMLQALMQKGTIFGFFDIISGGAFSRATVFTMGISPYINASIIIQLLTVAIPKFEQLSKEGEEGRKVIAKITRYTTVVLAFVQAVGFTLALKPFVWDKFESVLSFITITLSFTAGSAFLMWIGEQMTEKGIGNGISMLIFAGIVSRAPDGLYAMVTNFKNGVFGKDIIAYPVMAAVLLVFIAIIALVVWVQEAERRIPVQYAKRVVGRKMYGGQSTHIPIKVNLAGVMPIIFATSLVGIPATIVTIFAPNSKSGIAMFFKNAQNSIWGSLLTAALIIFFTFFYTYIQFNPIEVANNMKKNGGFIPGIRPGKPTSEYVSKILNRVTLFGALFLALIQFFPAIVGSLTGIGGVWFAGTSVLILVNVALDTAKQIESQMIMRHYKGFLE